MTSGFKVVHKQENERTVEGWFLTCELCGRARFSPTEEKVAYVAERHLTHCAKAKKAS